MEKIPTLFERNWDTDRKVNESLSVTGFDFSQAEATEKLDGMNVRVTVRSHTAVRLEKRRNPTKEEKARGIVDPWYVDTNPNDKADQYLYEALKNTDLSNVPDGEWSAEALGEKIQGNELKLTGHTLFFFTLPEWRARITYADAPTTYAELQEWLPNQKSKIGNDCGIEGLVWHNRVTGEMCKIKVKDFQTDTRR